MNMPFYPAAPAQTKDPTRKLRLELGLFAADDLVKDFGETYGIDKLTNPGVTTEKVFKATLLSNYISGVSIVFSQRRCDTASRRMKMR